MVQLPKSVKVGAHNYSVKYPYCFKERTDLNGQADHAMGEIRITNVDEAGNDRIPTAVINTFFHEILHCIDTVYFSGKMVKEEDVEKLVEGLAQGLTQVLLDNGLWKVEDDSLA